MPAPYITPSLVPRSFLLCHPPQVANPKPEDVECMCKLLSTVGGMLDASTKSVKNFNNSGKQFSTKVGGWVGAGGRAGVEAGGRQASF